MVNSFKRLNSIQIISFALLILSFILYCFNVKSSENFFWVSVGINMLGYLLFMMKWSKEGKTGIKKADKNYNKNLTRKPSEFIFTMVVAYYLLICVVVIAGIFIKDFMYEFGVVLGVLLVAFIWNFISLYIVNRTAKEVSMLIKGGINRGNK